MVASFLSRDQEYRYPVATSVIPRVLWHTRRSINTRRDRSSFSRESARERASPTYVRVHRGHTMSLHARIISYQLVDFIVDRCTFVRAALLLLCRRSEFRQRLIHISETIVESWIGYTGCFVTCGTCASRDCMPKNDEKRSYKYTSYLSSFMRYNELSVLITFAKDARN